MVAIVRDATAQLGIKASNGAAIDKPYLAPCADISD
jgi:hypothetical protein